MVLRLSKPVAYGGDVGLPEWSSKAGWLDPSTPFAGEPFINILDRDEQAHLSALLAKLVSQGRT
jgi:hypothetical protein